MFVRQDNAQGAKKEVYVHTGAAGAGAGSGDGASLASPGPPAAPSTRLTRAARLPSGSAVPHQQQSDVQRSVAAGREVVWNPVQAKFELMELSHRKTRLQERFNAVNRRSFLSHTSHELFPLTTGPLSHTRTLVPVFQSRNGRRHDADERTSGIYHSIQQ